VSADAAVVIGRVSRLRRVGEAGTLIDIALPGGFVPPLAGQFVQIACAASGGFRLRRPFSICSWQAGPTGGILGILFSVVGEGSRWLDERHPGDPIDLIGPLGRPFRPLPGRTPVLVGGGRGVAPLLLLGEQIAESYPDGLLLYGARDAVAIFPTEDCPYPVYRATMDGSVGHAGTAIDLLRAMLRQGGIRAQAAALYGCGPMPMLQALSLAAEETGIPVQVSLETTFGCGTGLCAGCAIPLRPRGGEESDSFHRYAFACTDGPVFDGTRVEWEGVEE
jgi:dihydroorotate dehydrogenase electron transfer subunit